MGSEDDKQLVPSQGQGPESGREGGRKGLRFIGGSDGQFRFGLLWCVAGGAAAPAVPLLAGFATAFGTCLITSEERRHAAWYAVAVSAAAGIVASLIAGVTTLTEIAIPLAMGVVAGLLTTKRRLTAGSLVLLCSAATALFMVGDALVARQAGTSLPASIMMNSQRIAELYRESAPGSVAVDLAVKSATSIVESYWPLMYFIAAGVCCLAAWLGTLMFTQPSSKGSSYAVKFRTYDLPLWVPALLIVGFALTVMHRQGLPVPQEAVFVAANLLQATRIAVALQGIAVTVWFLASRGVGPIGLTLSVVFGIWLETSFFVMSVLGLVDCLANFRALARKGIRARQSASDCNK